MPVIEPKVGSHVEVQVFFQPPLRWFARLASGFQSGARRDVPPECPKPVGRCMADEAAVRWVHDDGRATWLVQFAGFLAPQAPYLGPLFADPGQLSN